MSAAYPFCSSIHDRRTDTGWVVDAVKKTGRKRVVMAALWTEICIATPAIQAAGEGYASRAGLRRFERGAFDA